MIDRETTSPTDVAQPNAASASFSSKPRLDQLLVLIVATAMGMVGIWNCESQLNMMQLSPWNHAHWIVVDSPMLVSLGVGLMLAGLLPPRRRLSELCREPGFTACWVTTMVVAIESVAFFARNPASLTTLDTLIDSFGIGYFLTTYRVGYGVLIAWTTLALAGCWRPAPNWLDRSGRVMGVIMILAFVVERISWFLPG